jgi:hypothetical protein
MTLQLPKYISRDDLMERLNQEVSSLIDSDLMWWKSHAVAPFPVHYGNTSHFVVAVAGWDILFFADDEDEFGVAKLQQSGQTMTDYGLAGDLKDAIGIIQ